MKEHPKKELAFILFVEQRMELKAIGKMLGINANTLTGWNKKEDWKKLQLARRVAPEQLAARYMEHMGRIMDGADKDKRPLTIAEVDAIAKLSKSMSAVDRSINPSIVMSVLKRFGQYLLPIDNALAKAITDHHLNFVQTIIDAEK